MARTPQTIAVRARSDAFQLIEALGRNRRRRAQQQRFLVEGVRSIDQLRAAAGRWRVDAWVYADARSLSGWAQEILATSDARRHYALSAELMDALSDRDESSELLAVVELPRRELSDVPISEPALLVVVDRPQSPGNLGTLIRSCDALGAQALVVTGHAADLYDPRTIRAAAGSLFALPAVSAASTAELAAWLERIRAALPALRVIGTSASAERDVAAASLGESTVLVLGNERRGLSRALTELCDEIVAIPMATSGSASSLNLASAGSILLYEVGRQRAQEA